MDAFDFLPQNFRRWQGPTNDGLRENECSLSGGDNYRWWGKSEVVETLDPYLLFRKTNFFVFSGGLDAKTLGMSPRARANEPPSETFTT